MRRKSLWDERYYGRAIYFEKEATIIRKFVGHFYEKETLFKSFYQFDSFGETFNV